MGYVNYYQREITAPDENPPIGIVLCTDKNAAVARYTLPEDNQTFFTEKPKRMSAVITEKPPGPQDFYENLENIPLLTSFGYRSGYLLGVTRITPPPPSMSIEVQVEVVVLSWPTAQAEGFRLYSSDKVAGEYTASDLEVTDVDGISRVVVSPAEGIQFFILKKE